MLGHDWQPAMGTCVDDEWMPHTDREKWIMDVQPGDGSPPFRVEVPHPGAGEDFRSPNRGQVCKMFADVKKQKAKFDTSDPNLSWKAHRRAEQERVKNELNAPPGSPAMQFGATSYHLGASSYQVLNGADAAPVLNAILSGNPQERMAALRALREQRQAQRGGPSVPFQPAQSPPGAQAPFSGAPTPAPFGAGGPGAVPTPTPARFTADPQPASFGAPFLQDPVTSPTSASAVDLSERLNKLQTLHNQGLLSNAEFASQRQRILDSI
ncbi:MAG TPA: hypothetical protein VGX23_30865 [Actinocrinis sp.]|nr:hypothetical protein [Actinocrinis sp.]